MPAFNRVILAGNLTRDCELSYLPSNTPVCKSGLAINRRYKDNQGNQKEEVTFVDFTLFGRGAEVFNQYMAKGRAVLLEGRLHFSQWTDREGKNRSKLDVIVENFQFLGQGQGDGGGNGNQGGARAPAGRGQQQPSQEQGGPPADEDYPPASGADIPF